MHVHVMLISRNRGAPAAWSWPLGLKLANKSYSMTIMRLKRLWVNPLPECFHSYARFSSSHITDPRWFEQPLAKVVNSNVDADCTVYLVYVCMYGSCIYPELICAGLYDMIQHWFYLIIQETVSTIKYYIIGYVLQYTMQCDTILYITIRHDQLKMWLVEIIQIAVMTIIIGFKIT